MTLGISLADGSSALNDVFGIGAASIAQIMPMHVLLSPKGQISSIGPTLTKVLMQDPHNCFFLDVFKIIHPRNLHTLEDILAKAGAKFAIASTDPDQQEILFRAMAIRLVNPEGWTLIDLNFGANSAEFVKRYSLTSTDFRPNDLSIDLLYTFEIQRALLKDGEDLTAALKLAKAEAENIAMLDSVTGLANRRALHTRLDETLLGQHGSGPFTLILVDLNKFKLINDDFGHAAGDAVLQHTAQCLAKVAGGTGFAARLGGDEFAIILPLDGSASQAKGFELVDSIATEINIDHLKCSVSASLGLTSFMPVTATSCDRLMREADVALYRAKNLNQPLVIVTPHMLQEFGVNRAKTVDIERGLKAGEFFPYFQPQLDLSSGRVTGVEVLARWQHPERGVLSPAEFLDNASKAGLLVSLDEQVRRKALAVFSEMSRSSLTGCKLSLNLTSANLRALDFIQNLQDEVLLAGLTPNQVQLELLETIFLDGRDKTLMSQCRAIREAGFGLALDDFGTGHASISSLIHIPLTTLKIDRSFITGINRNEKLRSITRTIIRMARDIEIDVLAEGVETAEERRVLAEMNCQYVQGYYFARPMDAGALREWLSPSQLACQA